MKKTECPATMSGKHYFTKRISWYYPQCNHCGFVDDTAKLEESPIKIKRNKAEEKGDIRRQEEKQNQAKQKKKSA